MALQIPGYRIIRKIAQGGMSTVYLAIQMSVGRIVALKVMSPNLTSDPAFSERFQREATIVGQLSHPNIVAIYDIGKQGDYNYIAMDYLPGGSVHNKMIAGLNAEEALRITKDIANALDHAHERGYVHRDIKPENILFREDGSAVLTDFGVAKTSVGVSRMTHVGTVVGTPHYMSPEQTRGQAVDARSDLYSLGVLFYEMLTGTLPYQGEDAVAIALKHISAPIPRLPPQFQAFQQILDLLLAKDPAQRFQSGKEITEAIEQIELSTRAQYATPTPENLGVGALARALHLATVNAIRWRLNRLRALRWNKHDGFHFKTSTNDSMYGEDYKRVSVVTRVQQQTRVNPALIQQKINKLLLMSLAAFFALWFVASAVATYKFHANRSENVLAIALTLPHRIFGGSNPTPLAAKSINSNGQTNSSKPISATTNSALASQSSINNSVTLVETSSSSSQSSSQPPAYAVKLQVKPYSAKVKLLGIAAKYNDGLTLPNGKYKAEISANGYQTKTLTFEIKDKSFEQLIELEEKPPEITMPGGPISILVKGAPELLKIPVGSIVIGSNSNQHTSPAHVVTIQKAFAMSKFEVTFEEYDHFATETNQPLPGDNGWGRGNRPVIHVSWVDAQNYVNWLSQKTGRKFRLPTEAEWEYASRAGANTTFWWGDNEAEAKGKANCRRGCFSSYSGLFGSKTAPVGSFTPNTFGLYDMAGNVSEWTQDCYKENYETAPNNGKAVEEKGCAARVIRGGSTKDNVQHLTNFSRDSVPAGFLNEALGIRIVMEIN